MKVYKCTECGLKSPMTAGAEDCATCGAEGSLVEFVPHRGGGKGSNYPEIRTFGERIQGVVDEARGKHGFSAAAVVGMLEFVKQELIQEQLEAEDD